MANAFAKRKLIYYAPGGGPSVEVSINVYGFTDLTKEETAAAADDLAEKAMLSMRDAKHIHAPLTRIKCERPRK